MTAPADQHRGTRPRVLALWLGAWLVARLVVLALITARPEANALSDVAVYFRWTQRAWLHGDVLGRDFPSEYPPGALPLILLPVTDHGPFGYLRAFSGAMLAFDAALLLVLLRKAEDHIAAVVWVLAPLLLGPLFLERFDLVPAVLVGVALLVAERRRAVASALVTAAVSVKIWPLAVLPSLLRHRPRRFALGVSITASMILLASVVAGVQHAWLSSFQQQQGRGLQLEAVFATPFVWFGAEHAYRNGSWEVSGSTADLVASVSWLLGLVLLGLFVAWAARHVGAENGPTFALTGAATASILIVIDKALSPQYVTWLVAVVAAAACRPFAGRTAVIALTLLTMLTTHLVYPVWYIPLLHHELYPVVPLTIRNASLIAIALLLVRACRGARS